MLARYATLTTIAIAAGYFAVTVPGFTQSAVPREYDQGTIPFGATARQVMQELNGASVQSEKSGAAQFIGHYQKLLEFFSEGLYSNLIGIKQLNVTVTQMYRVSHESWENVVTIELYFFCEQIAAADPSLCRLFMMRKTLKTAGTGSYTTVSRRIEETMSRSLGIEPVSYEVKYQPFGQLFSLSSRVSSWKTTDTDIFVLVYQNFLSSGNADIVYRNRRLWEEYVKVAQANNSESKKRNQEQIRSVGNSP